jgi:competence protein ComEA
MQRGRRNLPEDLSRHKHTGTFQRLRGWLYRHDWQLAGVLGVAILAVALYVLWPRSPVAAGAQAGSAAISAEDIDLAQERTVIVYVSGAVRHPGLYTLNATLRVSDAIVDAGGLTEAADPDCLPNLAAHVNDAKQVAVPFEGGCSKSKKSKLDINGATWEQLLMVPGMDAQLADAIIQYREEFGGFVALTELKSGMGLDAATYRELAESLIVP